MATYEESPQIVRSRRNRERNGLTQDAPAFELDTIPDAQGSSKDDQGAMRHGALTTLALVPPSEFLGYFSTSALIINKMFGTGIFVTPAVVLAITNSKCTSLMLWLFGGLVTWAGLAVYLEYGIRFPLTGGELHYIDHVWLRPRMLMTYMYSLMFVVLSGSQANSLTFGKAIIIAATPEGTHIDTRLQKFFAILIIGIVCELQAFSRVNYVRFNNLFAVYKITLLTFLTILGWCVLAGKRTKAAEALPGPYGIENLRSDFGQTIFTPYNFALALLSIMRVFLGYENANFVLEEVRRPPEDKSRVYRRSSKFTVLMITFFYIMINLAFFAAIDTDDLIHHSDTLSIFLSRVFGPSPKARRASGVIQLISATGNIMSYTYANVRVKQEIARLGIIPYPEFWARTTRRGTPGPALLLTFIFTSIMIASSPLSDANGYLVISTLFTYARTWVGIFLGVGLLAAPWLQSFQVDGKSWRPSSTRAGLKFAFPLTLLFIAANLFVLIFSWWPADVHDSLQTTSPILPSVVGPIVGTCFLVAGAVYWLWDLHILRFFGYTWQVLECEPEEEEVKMLFTRYLNGPALCVYEFGEGLFHKLKRAAAYFAERWRIISSHL